MTAPCSQLPDGVFGIFKTQAPRCTGHWQLCLIAILSHAPMHVQPGYCKDKPKNRAFFSPAITMAASSRSFESKQFQLVWQLIRYPRSNMRGWRCWGACWHALRHGSFLYTGWSLQWKCLKDLKALKDHEGSMRTQVMSRKLRKVIHGSTGLVGIASDDHSYCNLG